VPDSVKRQTKSKANTRTYGFVDNMEQIVWKMATIAAVVDPVGLNAY